MIPRTRLLALAGLLALGLAPIPAHAQEGDAAAAVEALPTSASPEWDADAAALVEQIEEVMRGKTAHMVAAMTITRPRWSRTVRYRSWDDRENDRSLIRILDPSKDRGTGFLKVEQTLWTYLPRVERTTRMPPSMLLQSWMGSDFTNDDLVRESSMIEDYDARLIGEKEISGVTAVGIELIPKPDAPVVWAKLEVWVDKERISPMEQTYYDEGDGGGFEPIRRMRFSDVKDIGGRPVPHLWEMETVDEPGNATVIVLEEMEFDQPMPERMFSLTNLKRSEAAR